MTTMIKPRYTKTLKIVAVAALLIGLLWYFFSVRILTASVYVMLGWHAPLGFKVDCVRQTEKLVTQKFLLPLAFDQASKDGLRQFWHYSYYTGCLQNLGYDHYGDHIPESRITDGKYVNTFGKFSLDVGDVRIISDNQVDVAYDDRLMLSTLSQNDEVVTVGWYKKYDSMSLDAFRTSWTHFPHTDEALTIASDSGILTATNSAGLSGCMRFFDGLPILLYGQGIKINSCTIMLNSLRSQKVDPGKI